MFYDSINIKNTKRRFESKWQWLEKELEIGVNGVTPGGITVGYNGMFKFGETVGKVVNAQTQDYLLNW